MEMRTSTPQRFALWVYTANGPRRIEIQPFGQNVWLRASVPLQYFNGMDQSGTDLASTNNRRTNSFWMSVWGPFGELTGRVVGLAMQYPINKPTIEIRNVHLAKQDEGSEFLEKTPVIDEFGQWVHVDYPRKIKSAEQLAKELADEEKALGSRRGFRLLRIRRIQEHAGQGPRAFSMSSRSTASGGSSIRTGICSSQWA